MLLRDKNPRPKVLPLHLRSWQMLLLLVALNTQLHTPDNSSPLIILTDASVCSSSALMCQLLENQEGTEELLVTGVTSKMFSQDLCGKPAIYKEYLALVSAVKNFEHFIRANTLGTIIISDCYPLILGLRSTTTNLNFCGGSMLLSSLPNLKFCHVNGILLRSVDCLSRLFSHGYLKKNKIDKKASMRYPRGCFSMGNS